MERLTKTMSCQDGARLYDISNELFRLNISRADKTRMILEKLADYEDLEERLNKVYGDCDGLLLRVVEMLEKHPYIDMTNNTLKSRLLTDEEVDKWEEYKQLEEQGRLIKLPCKVGDTVYVIVGKNISVQKIQRATIDSEMKIEFCTKRRGFALFNIGKTVFLTKSEAEAKLKELKGGENESSNS